MTNLECYSKEAEKPRILIVDDRAVVRKELIHVLELSGQVSIVGEAADGWKALCMAEALKPDIVLMDLEMPVMDGFEATRQIKAHQYAHAVIIFTVYSDPENKQKALKAGADAFVVKGTDLTILLSLFIQLTHPQTEDPHGPAEL